MQWTNFHSCKSFYLTSVYGLFWVESRVALGILQLLLWESSFFAGEVSSLGLLENPLKLFYVRMLRLMRILSIWLCAENLGYFQNLLCWKKRDLYLWNRWSKERDRGFLYQWQLKKGWTLSESRVWLWEINCGGVFQVVAGCSEYLEGIWAHFRLMSKTLWKLKNSVSRVPCSFLLKCLLVSFRPYSLPSCWDSNENAYRETC